MNDKKCVKYIKEELKEYLQNNDNVSVSPNMWDAWKAVLRGKPITYTAFRKKEKQRHFSDLQLQMRNLETQHAT